MYIQVTQTNGHSAQPISMRCPQCGKEALMTSFGQDLVLNTNGECSGQRVCPNINCRAHVFVLYKGNTILASYPPSLIEFNSDGIPQSIIETFEEAIHCHSISCHTSAAIMIRRTLEEVCKDKEASGNNLKERIVDLREKVVVPKELLEAMDELRLLGNDAAHIEAKSYDKVSVDEVEVGIEFTKELLKALYQYTNLLSKLRSLKKDQH